MEVSIDLGKCRSITQYEQPLNTLNKVHVERSSPSEMTRSKHSEAQIIATLKQVDMRVHRQRNHPRKTSSTARTTAVPAWPSTLTSALPGNSI